VDAGCCTSARKRTSSAVLDAWFALSEEIGRSYLSYHAKLCFRRCGDEYAGVGQKVEEGWIPLLSTGKTRKGGGMRGPLLMD
jgi:hypothetical protein